MPSSYTEDYLVERPAIQLMRHELGWDVANCYDEWSGGVSNQGRDGKRKVVLVSRLRPALQRLNPDLPVEAIEGALGNYLLFPTFEEPIHFFDLTIADTTVAHLGDSHIKAIEFASPPEDLVRKASNRLEPLAQNQLNLCRRYQNLRRTRDLLLPKPLSSKS